MAKTKSKAPKQTVPVDDHGDPDIYALMTERDMSIDEAAELAGISGMKAWRLSLRQEVEHNPEQKIAIKDRAKLAARVAKERDENKVRWERLSHRTGLSRSELEALYEEHTGEPAGSLRGRKAEEDDEETTPTPRKAKKNGGKTKAKAEPEPVDEDEDEDEDDEVEEEAPKARPARRAKARK